MNAQKFAKQTNQGPKNAQEKALKKKIHLGFSSRVYNFKGMGFHAIKLI